MSNKSISKERVLELEAEFKKAREEYLREHGWMWMAICHGNQIVIQHRWVYLGDEKLYQCVDFNEAFCLQVELEMKK